MSALDNDIGDLVKILRFFRPLLFFAVAPRLKNEARMIASMRVNQAPSGTLVRAAVRKSPSKRAKGSQTTKTRARWTRHTMVATNVTRFVVMKVTKMTQTP